MTGYITRKIFYRALTLIFFIITCSTFLFAQGCPEGDPCFPEEGEGPGGEGIDGAPIDGGASILIAAGVAYGLKKANDKRKQNKETDIV